MGVLLNLSAGVLEFGQDGDTCGIVDPVRNSDDTAPIALIDGFNLCEKTVFIEITFGQIDEVRAVIGITSGKSCGSGQKSGVTSHDHCDINAW